MPGCAGCAGCCAHCAATCGAVSGGGFGAGLFGMGGLGAFSGFGFRPFFGGWNPAADENDTSTPVDGDALADPNHPSHRDAVATISHVDDDKHERILSWLHAEIHKLEHGGDTPA